MSDNEVIVVSITNEEADRPNITLAVEENSLRHYQSFIELFEQEHPNLTVRLVSINEVTTSGNDDEIQIMASAFDIFPYNPIRQGGTEYLLDLRPLRDLDPQFDTNDFLPGLLPPATEPLWAIPTGAAYYITFFDKGAFDDARLSHPDLDWTTDDFLDAALALTVREGDDVTRWGYVPGQMRYPPLLASQLAGPLTTPDGGLRLADPDVVAAVQWLGDLFTVHQVSPWLDEYRPTDRRTGGGQTAQGLINRGQAAIWHTTHLLFDENEENVGVTAVPQSLHGLTAEPLIYGFAVSRGTANREATWQLLHFLSRQPPQEAMFSVGPVPARRSVAAANSYWEQLPDGLAPALQYTVENSVAPRITHQAANLLQGAIAAHIDDNTPVTAALGQLLGTTDTPAELSETEVIVVPEVGPDPTDDTRQITFVTLSPLVDTHRLLAEAFQREHSNMRVQVERPDDFELRSVTAADCFVTSVSSLRNEPLRATVLTLEPLLELDGRLQTNEFYPSMLNAVMEEGEVFGLPAFMRVALMHYNRELFEANSIPEPPLDWMLSDFLEIAQQATMGEGETKQFGYAEPFPYLFSYGVTAFGVQVADQSEGIPWFDFEVTEEMVTWFADLIRLYEVQPLLSGNSMVDFSSFQELLQKGQVGIWPSLGTELVVGMQNAPLNYDIGTVTIPLGPSGSRGIVESAIYAYAIFADTTEREVCWEWIKFLSLHPQASPVRGGNVYFPAHIETSKSKMYLDLVGSDVAGAAYTTVNSSHVSFHAGASAWMRPGFNWLEIAYLEVSSGEVDVSSALAEADTKFTRYRECVILADAFDDLEAWQMCANQVD